MSSPQDSIASAHDRAGERSRLRVAIVLTAFILLLEAAGGLYSNSLALLSDAGHVMTDLAGLLLCYAALALALRPATARKTYGWYRIEILAALVNGALLFALAVGIFLESVRRLQHPPTVLTLPMMLTAGLGLVVNVAAMTVLLRGRSNINLRGALIHVFGDTLSSVGVLLTGALIMATGWTGADAVMGMLIGVIIVVGALRLLRDAVDVLLEATPAGIELIRVADAISEIKGVRAVHDLHIWSITSGMPALSGHVVIEDGAEGSSDETLNRIKRMLHYRFSIGHSTLQIESPDYQEFGEIH